MKENIDEIEKSLSYTQEDADSLKKDVENGQSSMDLVLISDSEHAWSEGRRSHRTSGIKVGTRNQRDSGHTGPEKRPEDLWELRKRETVDQWPVTRGSVRVTVGLRNSGHKASEKQQVFRTIGLCAQWTKGPLGTHTRRNTGHTGAGEHCTLRNSRRLRKKEQWVHSIRETNGSQ